MKERLLNHSLIEKLRTGFTQGVQKANELDRRVLVSITHPFAGPIDPILLFSPTSKPKELKIFWSQPAHNFWLVGIGNECQLPSEKTHGLPNVRKDYQSLLNEGLLMGINNSGTGPLMFGGFKFDPEADPDQLWSEFPNEFFSIPNILITNDADRYWVTVNTIVQPEFKPSILLEQTVGSLRALGEFRRSQHSTEPEQLNAKKPLNISQEEWNTRVNLALDTIKTASLEKVVLARTKEFNLSQNFKIQHAFNDLCVRNKESTIFGISIGNSTFFGATPETLLRSANGFLTSICLAGSIRRGKTQAEDESLSQQLFHSAKDQSEHMTVVREISRIFRETCDNISWDKAPTILKLPTVQHLATNFSGVLKTGVDIFQLLDQLHPTPAVGGVPREKAMEFIRQSEGDRGWYASPIGWIDGNDNGEFVIAIRSGLIRDSRAVLFAGSGIVKGSTPESEWAETELKFKPLLSALNGDVEE